MGFETCSVLTDFSENTACSFYLTLPAQMEISSEPTIWSDWCVFFAKLNLDTLLMLSHYFRCIVGNTCSSPFSFTTANFSLYHAYCSSNLFFIGRRAKNSVNYGSIFLTQYEEINVVFGNSRILKSTENSK